MPKYGSINERRNQLHEVIRLSGMNLIIDDNDYPLIIKVASIQSARMQVYFIDNDDFFQRKHTVADDQGVEFEDNDDRSIFFVRGVIETIRKLRWVPDVVHVHGWIAALAPLYIKRAFAEDPCFRSTKVVYSVYDNAFKLPFRESFKQKLLIDGVTASDLQDLNGVIDHTAMTKLAMRYSDGVIQGSEIMSPELLEVTAELDVPFLAYQEGDCYIESYNDFYDQICG